jgi:hypothetical protein
VAINITDQLEDEWRKKNNMFLGQEENGNWQHADPLEVMIKFLKMQWSWNPWLVTLIM